MALTDFLLSKNSVIFVLATVSVLAIAYILVSRDSVKKAHLIYENPAVIRQVRIQRVEGPVRIVERIVEKPGEKVTERTETREVVTENKDTDRSKTPFITIATGREYILGLSWRTSLTRNGTLWAGASVLRGLDLLAGVGGDGGKLQGYLMIQGRFGG